MANAPDIDLQWMSMERAQLGRDGEDQKIEVLCRNSPHNLDMYCAVGVRVGSKNETVRGQSKISGRHEKR